MRNILLLFIRNGGFVTLVVVEALCFFLVVQYNSRANSIFSNTSARFSGYFLEKWSKVTQYVGIAERLDSLQQENARLNAQLLNARLLTLPFRDTSRTILLDTLWKADSAVVRRLFRPFYEYIPAKVLSNTISNNNNWLLLNRGSADGVVVSSAVIAHDGIVGIVRHVDQHYCSVMSLLHRQTKISAALEREGAFGSLVWEGQDPTVMTLKVIPKHVPVHFGDAVITSGYSQMFPRGLAIGTVADSLPVIDPENPYFFSLRIRLQHDMARTNEVMIVTNIFRSEIDSLVQKMHYE